MANTSEVSLFSSLLFSLFSFFRRDWSDSYTRKSGEFSWVKENARKARCHEQTGTFCLWCREDGRSWSGSVLPLVLIHSFTCSQLEDQAYKEMTRGEPYIDEQLAILGLKREDMEIFVSPFLVFCPSLFYFCLLLPSSHTHWHSPNSNLVLSFAWRKSLSILR